jgi:hypothetical protein
MNSHSTRPCMDGGRPRFPPHFALMTHHIARNGQQLGVYAEEEIQPGLITGRFLPDDLFWTEGMAEWQPLSTRFAVSVATPAFAAAASAAPAFNPYAAPQANVVTPAMMPQLKLASRGVRLAAAIIDTIIIMVALIVPVVVGVVLMGNAEKVGGDDVPVAAITFFALAGVAMLVLLIWNAVWLSKYGQSIAKRMLKIKVVSPSRRPECRICEGLPAACRGQWRHCPDRAAVRHCGCLFHLSRRPALPARPDCRHHGH